MQWLSCALYVACRSAVLPTLEPGKSQKGNGVSLTHVLRETKVRWAGVFVPKCSSWQLVNETFLCVDFQPFGVFREDEAVDRDGADPRPTTKHQVARRRLGTQVYDYNHHISEVSQCVWRRFPNDDGRSTIEQEVKVKILTYAGFWRQAVCNLVRWECDVHLITMQICVRALCCLLSVECIQILLDLKLARKRENGDSVSRKSGVHACETITLFCSLHSCVVAVDRVRRMISTNSVGLSLFVREVSILKRQLS